MAQGQLHVVREAATERNIALEFSDIALGWLVRNGYDPNYGTETVVDTTWTYDSPFEIAADLDRIPHTAANLTRLGRLDEAAVPWLYRMWADRPVGWLLQWPVVGHANAHVGEGISIRNRMGLSPF